MINPLISLIRGGQLGQVASLLDSQPELINKPDNRGFTPLIMSTYLGNELLTGLLIEYGADVDYAGAAGNTALMGVAFKGDKKC